MELYNWVINSFWTSNWCIVLDAWEQEFDQRWQLGKKYFLKKYELSFTKPLHIPLLNDRIWIEIFDPEFYFDTKIFLTIPKYKLILEAGSFVNLNIKAEYYEMINTPSKPCNNSAEYSFTKCVKVKKDYEDCFNLPKK